LQPAHFVRNSGTSLWSLGYYKCVNPTDLVPTWTKVDIATTGTVYTYAEPSIVKLSETELLILARKTLSGANTCYHQWYSSDNGETWIDQGDTTFDTWAVTTGRERPGFITRIDYYGKIIIPCYYVNTSNQKFNAIYAKASDFATLGVAAWNVNTLVMIKQTEAYDSTTYTRNGYQTILHEYNRWGGIGQIYMEYSAVLNKSDIDFFWTPLSNRGTVLNLLY
jgi:hypothetical protein